MNRDDVRRWVQQRRDGDALIRAEHRRVPVDASEELARAFALMAFADRFRDPLEIDPISAREDQGVIAAWARVRAAWAARQC